MRLSAALCVLLMGLTAARAEAGPHFSDDGSLQVESVWARMAPKEADTASVFFEVTSHSSKSDELLSASSPVAETITLRRGTWKGWDFFNKASEGIRIKANSFRAAEVMGHQHGHMAAELAAGAFHQQRQPGEMGVGPQAPKPAFGDFRQFAGVSVLPGPVQGQLELVFQGQ